MNKLYTYLLSAKIVMVLLLLSACGRGGKSTSISTQGEKLPMQHAEQIIISKQRDCTVVELKNPWKEGEILHTYVLVDKELPLPAQLPKGTLLRTPLTKMVIYSSVHCSLLNQLGAIENIAGVCDLNYIKLPIIHERQAAGELADMGDSMSPNIEKMIDLHPDAILLSPFENSGGYGRIEKLNIPLIECADYMETSPLGRAEWMLFYGLLVGKEEAAKELFTQVETNYQQLKTMAQQVTYRPTVMSDLKSSSTWYTAGGNSTTAKYYADAGADYLFKEDKRSGSLPTSFEVMFERGESADYWIIRYNQPANKSYKELKEDFAPYAGFKAYKERHIYGCNTHYIPFYEESPFRPDVILQEFIKIFHPTLLPHYELKYFSTLAE
ncbi:MAG: ABC transporter substrate-binding protein [Phocaeicola sp.]